jgi:hypothetical protein
MKEIERIYYNEFGVAFYWKKHNNILRDKIQMVFKETGFYFTYKELVFFAKLIEDSTHENSCKDCSLKHNCGRFLLKTPFTPVDLAVSFNELTCIKDLVEGALFKINLERYLNGEGLN